MQMAKAVLASNQAVSEENKYTMDTAKTAVQLARKVITYPKFRAFLYQVSVQLDLASECARFLNFGHC